jgi:hypothetical protein
MLTTPTATCMMLKGSSPSAATIPVESDAPKSSAIKKDSARKYPPTITTLPVPQPMMSRPLKSRLEISPAVSPSAPLITRVNGAKTPKPPSRSDRADPTPPANPPTSGPKVSAVMKIMTSPRLKYPPVAGIGTWKKKVDPKTMAVITDVSAVFMTGLCLCEVCFEAAGVSEGCKTRPPKTSIGLLRGAVPTRLACSMPPVLGRDKVEMGCRV